MEKKVIIDDKETTLQYRKYDAIAVEGPLDAKNGKQFFKCLFEENADDNGGYSSQSRGYVKNFFEDTHSLLFKKCELHQDNEKLPVRIVAAKENVQVNPYYMFDAEGKAMLNPTTKEPLIGHRLSIFLLPDEDAQSEIRRRSKLLKFVAIEEDPDDVEESKAKEAATVK